MSTTPMTVAANLGVRSQRAASNPIEPHWLAASVVPAPAPGIYALAKELLGYPLRFIQPLIARFTLPALARVQHDSAALRTAYVRTLRITALGTGVVYGPLAALPTRSSSAPRSRSA